MSFARALMAIVAVAAVAALVAAVVFPGAVGVASFCAGLCPLTVGVLVLVLAIAGRTKREGGEW